MQCLPISSDKPSLSNFPNGHLDLAWRMCGWVGGREGSDSFCPMQERQKSISYADVVPLALSSSLLKGSNFDWLGVPRAHPSDSHWISDFGSSQSLSEFYKAFRNLLLPLFWTFMGFLWGFKKQVLLLLLARSLRELSCQAVILLTIFPYTRFADLLRLQVN